MKHTPNPCHVEQGRPTKEGVRRRNIHVMSPAFKSCQGVLPILVAPSAPRQFSFSFIGFMEERISYACSIN
jgi:hypothetical protein